MNIFWRVFDIYEIGVQISSCIRSMGTHWMVILLEVFQ